MKNTIKLHSQKQTKMKKKRSLYSQSIEQEGVQEAEAAEEMGSALVGYPMLNKGVFCTRVRETVWDHGICLKSQQFGMGAMTIMSSGST